MKRFTIRLLLFTALLAACYAATIYPLICCFESEAYACKSISPYHEVNRIYCLSHDDADLVITGNSRAEVSYNDSLLSLLLGRKCLNIGWSGYPFDYQYHVMLQTYLAQNKKPRLIVQEISPWAFLDYVMPRYSIEMMPYINRDEFRFLRDMCPEITSWDSFRLVRYAGKMSKLMAELKNIKGITEKYPHRAGFEKDYIGEKHSLERNAHILQLFHKFIGECRRSDIPVVFVCSPMHRDEGQACFDMTGFWQLFDSIASAHGITTLNYQDLYGNDTAFFANSMHLNTYGRDCFTQAIAHDLDSILHKTGKAH